MVERIGVFAGLRPLLLAAAAALGCQSGFYEEYRAAHPGFEPVLPRVDASLMQVLAALHAPTPVESIEVELSQLAIFRTDGERWSEIPFETLRIGEASLPDAADIAVLVAWTCRFEAGLDTRGARKAGYYLLPGGRLVAYDHYGFRERCRSENEFRAARDEALVATEREALGRVSAVGTRLSLAQAYRRGLEYVEAGRLPEARGMLVVGERSYRASVRKLRAAGELTELAEVERMRRSLMRALGVREPTP